jgi:hypothetical protein
VSGLIWGGSALAVELLDRERVVLVRITFVRGRGCSSMLLSVGSVESEYP